MLNDHKSSKKHKKAEKEWIKDHPDAELSSIFKSIQHESTGSDILSELNRSLQASDGQPLTIEEENAPHVKTTLESLRICLFCNEEFPGVKRCIDHMRFKHNFMILDIECLVNLKGLLAYVAERIQLGKMCLGCNKQFRSAARCQQHMIDKGHCMMPMDADEEFELFYDFRRAYADLNVKRKARVNAITAIEILSEAENDHTMAEERKIMIQQKLAQSNGKEDDVEEVSDDDWDECDVEDDKDLPVLEQIPKAEESKETSSF